MNYDRVQYTDRQFDRAPAKHRDMVMWSQRRFSLS